MIPRRTLLLQLLDPLQVPDGYRADVLLSWGDRLGADVMGFNNDYLAFTALSADQALLTINIEYISARPWCAGYAEARGNELPFSTLAEAMQTTGGAITGLGNPFGLADFSPGEGITRMGAILTDAHLAANAISAAPTARREDTEIDPCSGDLLISFTMGGSDETGSADPTVFRGPSGETPWPYG